MDIDQKLINRKNIFLELVNKLSEWTKELEYAIILNLLR